MSFNLKRLSIVGLLGLGAVLGVGSTDARAQMYRGRWGGYGPGVRYAPPVFMAPSPVVVTQSQYLVTTPTIVRQQLIQPAPVVQTQVVQPPPVVETRVVQPPPVVERRIVQPPAYQQSTVIQPPPVVETDVIRSTNVVAPPLPRPF